MTNTTSKIFKADAARSCAVNNYFNGAAVVDDLGNETPITESMIQHACNVLHDSWKFPSTAQQGRYQTVGHTISAV